MSFDINVINNIERGYQMKEIIITCEECKNQYFGEFLDSTEKTGQYGKYREVIYQAHCTVCDEPVFTTRTVKL